MFFWPLPAQRGIGQEGQGRGGDDGLEEQTRTIPAKVCSLKAKVARQSGWLEALYLARPPDAEAAGAGGANVANVKMNRIDKAVKGLQRELEVEEREQRSTGELVLELKEMG